MVCSVTTKRSVAYQALCLVLIMLKPCLPYNLGLKLIMR